MMRFARKEDFSEVIGLWQEAFGDTQEEIEEFFALCEDMIRICVWEEENRIVAQLVLIPVTLACEREYAAEYIYAVTVKKQFRGCGFATKLLKEIRNLLKEEGKAGILVPAEKTLVRFYEKRGFVKCFSEEKIEMTLSSKDNMTTNMTGMSSESETTKIKEITAERYQELRSTFKNEGFVDFSLRMLSYAVHSICKEGGKCVQVTYRNKDYGLLYRQSGAEICVFEITAQKPEEAWTVTKLLLNSIESKKIERVFIRRSYLTMATNLSEQLLEALKTEKVIFNLVMD